MAEYDPEQLVRENEALRERVTALSEATLRVGATLDVTTVLEEIVRSARILAGARYAAIVTTDDSGAPVDFVTSGFTADEDSRFRVWADGPALFERLGTLSEPLHIDDLPAFVASLGMSGAPALARNLHAVPMRHRAKLIGSFYLAEKEKAPEFTVEDEEVLVLFAAQAAAAVANARAHRDEQRARGHLEALVETSPVGVIVFDAGHGRAVSHNREAERIVKGLRTPGRPVESLLQELTVRRQDGTETALSRFPVAAVLSKAETVRAEEIVLTAQDGRSVAVLVNATPVRGEDGTVASVAVTMQDLEPLHELERQRAEFLGLVSHELRTPLSAIKGSAATVLGTPGDLDAVEMRGFFRIVEQQADHMRALIADLLDAGRIETGTLSVTPEPTEVATLVERARLTFLASQGGRALQIDLPADLPPVMADRQRIVQVLNNLFANAAMHAPTTSPICVEAAVDGTHVAVSVVDEGAGVSADRLPYLFRKHGAAPTGGRHLGSGLGLAICKGLVEAHGGRIRADSPGVGQGTRITFTIPTADVAVEKPASSLAVQATGAVGGKARILVVDDDPQILRFARNALDGPDYATIVTGDPDGVGALIREHRPHLVLLDLLLPDVDGVDLMSEVPGLGDLPVIFISVYGRDETIARALEAGAADYIVKPFSPTELVARIRNALRRYATTEPFRLGELAIDYDERRVTVRGEPVVLTATEYELLRVLSANVGRVTTYEVLRRRVWDGRAHVGPALVRTFIKKLRRKLGDDPARPAYIQNERGVGYRMPRPD